MCARRVGPSVGLVHGPEDDHQLGLAAVGLWHRLATAGEPVGPLELLTLAGDTSTWNPRGRLDDVEPPLDELLATGWVVEQGDQYVAARPETADT